MHSFADRADTSLVHIYSTASSSSSSSSRSGGSEVQESNSEDPQLSLLSSGLLGTVAMALSTEPLQSPYRFWLASVIEAFLRGGRPENLRAAIAHLPIAKPPAAAAAAASSLGSSSALGSSRRTEMRRSSYLAAATSEKEEGSSRSSSARGEGAGKQEQAACLVDFLVQLILRPRPSPSSSPSQGQPNDSGNGAGSSGVPASAGSDDEDEDGGGGGDGAVNSEGIDDSGGENANEEAGSDSNSNGDLQSACDLLAEVVKFSPTALLTLQKALIGWQPPSPSSPSVETKACAEDEDEDRTNELPMESAKEHAEQDIKELVLGGDSDNEGKPGATDKEEVEEAVGQPPIPPGFNRLLEVLLANIVDANVLFRAVLLTLDSSLCPQTAACEKGDTIDDDVNGADCAWSVKSVDSFLPSRNSSRRPLRVFSLRQSPRTTSHAPTAGSDGAAQAGGTLAVRQSRRETSSASHCSFTILRRWLVAVEARVLAALLASVSFEDVSHENVCAINTALLLLLLAKRQGRMPALLSAVDAVADVKERGGVGREGDSVASKMEDVPVEASWSEVEAINDGGLAGGSGSVVGSRDSGHGKRGTESLRVHFRPLLWFWGEYYGPRGRDRRSLETSSRITYKVRQVYTKSRC